MRPSRLWLVIVLSSCFAALTVAQTTSSSSPQALAVLQSALNALTGSTAVRDITLTGTAHRIVGSDDETGTVTFKAMSSGTQRLDLSLASGVRSESRTLSTNGPGGSWSGPDGVVHAIASHNLVTDSGLFPAITLLGFATTPNCAVSYIGQETKEGVSVLHVVGYQQYPALTTATASLMQHLSQVNIFLDASTLLPVFITYDVHPDNDALLDIPVELQFSEYHEVNGIRVPFHVQKLINNTLALDLQFQSAALNTGLAASDFQLQ